MSAIKFMLNIVNEKLLFMFKKEMIFIKDWLREKGYN
jgi:hypothetical protein